MFPSLQRKKKERLLQELAQENAEQHAHEQAKAAALATADELAAQLLLVAEEARLDRLKQGCLSYVSGTAKPLCVCLSVT